MTSNTELVLILAKKKKADFDPNTIRYNKLDDRVSVPLEQPVHGPVLSGTPSPISVLDMHANRTAEDGVGVIHQSFEFAEVRAGAGRKLARAARPGVWQKTARAPPPGGVRPPRPSFQILRSFSA